MSEDVRDICNRCVDNVYDTNGDDGSWELVTIDNGSDYPVIRERDRFVYIRNERNRGVAKAWNQGVKRSSGDLIVFLNSDAFPEGKWLEALRRGMSQKCDNLPIGALSPTQCEDHQLPMIRQNVPTINVGLTGACFMMSREVLNEVGEFDMKLSPFFEDQDMWRRLKNLGYALANTTEVCMTHLFSQSAKQLKDVDKIKEIRRKRYKEKYNGR